MSAWCGQLSASASALLADDLWPILTAMSAWLKLFGTPSHLLRYLEIDLFITLTIETDISMISSDPSSLRSTPCWYPQALYLYSLLKTSISFKCLFSFGWAFVLAFSSFFLKQSVPMLQMMGSMASASVDSSTWSTSQSNLCHFFLARTAGQFTCSFITAPTQAFCRSPYVSVWCLTSSDTLAFLILFLLPSSSFARRFRGLWFGSCRSLSAYFSVRWKYIQYNTYKYKIFMLIIWCPIRVRKSGNVRYKIEIILCCTV